MSEKCQRCGEKGEDRRTLWMACFYEMGELELPFEQVAVEGRFMKQTGEEIWHFGPHEMKVPQFEAVNPEQEPHKYKFFTLRVCKKCRADWMQAIKKWFHESKTQDESARLPQR